MQFEHVVPKAGPMVLVSKRCAMSEIAPVVSGAFAELGRFMAEAVVAPAGPPLAVYKDVNTTSLTVEVGFPVAEADLARVRGGVRAGTTPGGDAVKVLYRGGYAGLADVYGQLGRELGRAGIAIGPTSWEVYLNDPQTVRPQDLLTEVYVGIAANDVARLPDAAASA